MKDAVYKEEGNTQCGVGQEGQAPGLSLLHQTQQTRVEFVLWFSSHLVTAFEKLFVN